MRSDLWITDCSPCNNVVCIVDLEDSTYTLAQQRSGEWEDCLQPIGYEHDEVVRWRALDDECCTWLRSALEYRYRPR